MSTTAYNKYPKGSEWRRWDLHFHTPSSYDYKNKSISNQEIIAELVKNQIAVIAITDHHVIDVQRIQELQSLGKDRITVLPGIEFLSDSRGSDPIHFIGIFPENSNIQFIWEQIKNKTNISRIEGEGLKINEVYCDLFQTSDLIHQLGGIVTIHAGSKTNTIDNITNSLEHGIAQKEDIAKIIDIFELGKEEDLIPYMTLVNSYLERKINKVLPLIICSDNHDVKNYNVKQLLWIKADPTFEGLKQILFEPLDRVHIGEEIPDEKLLYHIIDKVKFQDTNFSTQEIELSSNLTAIIGGKSTGKSILLRNISKTIDPEEFSKRHKTAGLLEPKSIAGMEVIWKDGQKSSLGSEQNVNKRIIYIPQSYLNRVVDFDKKRSDIDEIIREILLQDESFAIWFNSLHHNERLQSNTIDLYIKTLFDHIDNFYSSSEEIKKIGDESGIKQQIKKISEEITAIQSKLNLSEQEILIYNQKIELINSNKLVIENFNHDILILTNISNNKIEIYNPFEFELKNPEFNLKLEALSIENQNLYSSDWKVKVDNLILEYKAAIEVLNGINNKEIESIALLQSKIDGQKNLQEKFKLLAQEKQKDQKLEEIKLKKTSSQTAVLELIDLLSESCANYYSLYLEAKDKINRNSFDEELKFEIETEFVIDDFQKNFVEMFFDGRSIKKEEYKHVNEFTFSNREEYKNQIKLILREIINTQLPKRDGFSNKEIVTGLLKNWFAHIFKVEYLGDQLIDMSPGKKSFVLLRLLIDLDNSKCPILIDQPEDDLDNRSIYNQVVKFLRRKKSERQIIIATHNPNLVLGADAEQIIVANQEGKDSKNKSSKFEYVSGSIEHSFKDSLVPEILYSQGVQEHICDILEGGEEAFLKRKNKYRFKQ